LATLKANEKKQRDDRQAKQLDRLKTKLNLTDEQTAKIKSNQAATHGQLEAIKQNDKLERSEKMAQLNTLKTKLRGLSSDWMQEGFEKDEIIEYIKYLINEI
jgi:hypothetical protein